MEYIKICTPVIQLLHSRTLLRYEKLYLQMITSILPHVLAYELYPLLTQRHRTDVTIKILFIYFLIFY